jgi:hypothetical protein
MVNTDNILIVDVHLICGFGSSIGVYAIDRSGCEYILGLEGVDDSDNFGFISTYLEDDLEYILGVTNAPEIYVYLWVIVKSELNDISVNFILKKRVPVQSDVLSIRRATFFEKRQDYNIGPYLFGTLSSQGILKCWHLGWRGILKELTQENVECVVVLEQNIPKAKSFSFGRLGYVTTGISTHIMDSSK